MNLGKYSKRKASCAIKAISTTVTESGVHQIPGSVMSDGLNIVTVENGGTKECVKVLVK